MRRAGRVGSLTLSLLLGLAVGIAAIAVHRTVYGAVLALTTTLVSMWTLRLWVPRAATAFAAGWLVALLVAIAGRAEGDYAVSSDGLGWLLIGSGFVVLVAGVAWTRPPVVRSDSGSLGAAT